LAQASPCTAENREHPTDSSADYGLSQISISSQDDLNSHDEDCPRAAAVDCRRSPGLRDATAGSPSMGHPSRPKLGLGAGKERVTDLRRRGLKLLACALMQAGERLSHSRCESDGILIRRAVISCT